MALCRTGYVTLDTRTACPQRVVIGSSQTLNRVLVMREVQVNIPSPVTLAVAIVEREVPTGVLDVTEVDVGRTCLTGQAGVSRLDQHVGSLLVIPLECTTELTTSEGCVDTDVDHLVLLPLRVAVTIGSQAIGGLLAGVRARQVVVGSRCAGREDVCEVRSYGDLRVTRDTVTYTQFQVV